MNILSTEMGNFFPSPMDLSVRKPSQAIWDQPSLSHNQVNSYKSPSMVPNKCHVIHPLPFHPGFYSPYMTVQTRPSNHPVQNLTYSPKTRGTSSIVNIPESNTPSASILRMPISKTPSPSLISRPNLYTPSPSISSIPESTTPSLIISSIPKSKTPSPSILSIPKSNTPSPSIASIPKSNIPSPSISSIPKSNSPSLSISSIPKSNIPSPGISSIPKSNAPSPSISSIPKSDTRSPSISSIPESNTPSSSISNISESGMNSPSPKSPESIEQETIQKDNINKEFENCEAQRRLSEASDSTEDANNNETKKIVEPTSTQTIEEVCSTEKLTKSPQKSWRKPPCFESPITKLEKELEDIGKEDRITPEYTRLGPSPTSSFSSEPDICDSTNRLRVTRPFKAITTGSIIDNWVANGPLGDFETFRENIMSKVNSTNKCTNQNMRRMGNSMNANVTDPTYWEKRKRNNEAAKRSRDARRRKEDEIAIRCAYLEQERIMLVQEVKMLRKLLEEHRQQSKVRYHPYMD